MHWHKTNILRHHNIKQKCLTQQKQLLQKMQYDIAFLAQNQKVKRKIFEKKKINKQYYLLNKLQMFAFYSRLLDKYPVATKIITSGVFFSAGDIISQKVVEKKPEIDIPRNINISLTGAFYIAPCLHLWYCKLLPRVGDLLFKNSGKTTRVFGSMAMDQLLFAPILLTGFYFFYSTVRFQNFEKGFSQGIIDVKQRIQQTLLTNWKIWPLATTINFWFMPLKYQVLFANFVGFFWNIILTYIANK